MNPTATVLVPILSHEDLVRRLLEPIAGRCSLQRTIDHAREYLPAATIVVTTDDPLVKDKMDNGSWGASLHDRTRKDYDEALFDALGDDAKDDDIVVVLEATHPFRPEGLIERTVRNLTKLDHLDSVLSVNQLSGQLWYEKSGDILKLLPDEVGDRSYRHTYFQQLTGLCLATRARCIKDLQRVGDVVGFEIIDAIWSLIDLHDDDGLRLANLFANFQLNSKVD
jgi:hypothetical protein